MVALTQIPIPVHPSIREFVAWNPGDGRINMRVPGLAAYCTRSAAHLGQHVCPCFT